MTHSDRGLARVAPAADALAQLADVADQARDYAAAARAPNTLRAYRADWQHFTSWAEAHGPRRRAPRPTRAGGVRAPSAVPRT